MFVTILIVLYLLVGLWFASIEEHGEDQLKRILWAWLLIFLWLPIMAIRLTKRAPDAPKRGAKVVKSKSKVIKGRARR